MKEINKKLWLQRWIIEIVVALVLVIIEAAVVVGSNSSRHSSNISDGDGSKIKINGV